jgi:hypothetical protein
MTQPGDQPSLWSREGQWLSQNQPQIPVYPPASGPDPLLQFDPAPAAKLPATGYPEPYPSHPTGFFPPPAPYAPPPPPPKRRTGLWIALAAVTAVLVGLAMWGVIADNRAHPVVSSGGSGADPVSLGDTKVVTASDKKSQLTVPASWRDIGSSLKIDEASIQLGEPRREQYLAVASIEMTDFESFTAFADASIDSMTGAIDGAQVGPRSQINVGGLNGVRYEIAGTAAGIKAVFWYTLIEGKRGFYQVIAWTLPSHKAEAEPVILKVIDSFRELTG